MVSVFPHQASPGDAQADTYDLFLVEDHPAMRLRLRRLVEGEPHLRVLGEADSAEDALRVLADLAPDLVLVDLSLPGASGLDLIRRLKLERPSLVCLVVTGHVEAFYRVSALAAGAADFVEKGDPDALLQAIYRALDHA